MAELLHVTCKTKRRPNNNGDSNSTNPNQAYDVDMLFAKISSLENTQYASETNDIDGDSKADKDDDDAFVKEINNRLPTPLKIILNLLTTSSSSRTRVAVADLCRTILMDTLDLWAGEKQATVERTTLECCFVLTQDENGTYNSEKPKFVVL